MERKLAECQGPDSAREAADHLRPFPVWAFKPDVVAGYSYTPQLMLRLGRVLFPVPLHKYEGRLKSLAKALGYSPASVSTYKRRGGDDRLTLPVIAAAEKLIAAQQIELAAIAEGLANKRRELESAKASKPRLAGMFTVRVRDGSGIPRDAVWRGKKLEPF